MQFFSENLYDVCLFFCFPDCSLDCCHLESEVTLLYFYDEQTSIKFSFKLNDAKDSGQNSFW